MSNLIQASLFFHSTELLIIGFYRISFPLLVENFSYIRTRMNSDCDIAFTSEKGNVPSLRKLREPQISRKPAPGILSVKCSKFYPKVKESETFNFYFIKRFKLEL